MAEKSRVKAVRPNWWAELKAAHPDIPITPDGRNFENLYAGQELRIPES